MSADIRRATNDLITAEKDLVPDEFPGVSHSLTLGGGANKWSTDADRDTASLLPARDSENRRGRFCCAVSNGNIVISLELDQPFVRRHLDALGRALFCGQAPDGSAQGTEALLTGPRTLFRAGDKKVIKINQDGDDVCLVSGVHGVLYQGHLGMHPVSGGRSATPLPGTSAAGPRDMRAVVRVDGAPDRTLRPTTRSRSVGGTRPSRPPPPRTADSRSCAGRSRCPARAACVTAVRHSSMLLRPERHSCEKVAARGRARSASMVPLCRTRSPGAPTAGPNRPWRQACTGTRTEAGTGQPPWARPSRRAVPTCRTGPRG